MAKTPALRIHPMNDAPVRAERDFVLYWMVANRRATDNFSLQRAVEWAEELDKPLVVLEALRVGYRWASDRFHAFILQGMADNVRTFAEKPVLYYPYVETAPDAGKGLLKALGQRACVVVTDDFPAFMLPHMIAAGARQVDVTMEAVDSNGILPMRAAPQVFTTAYAFRRYLQNVLISHLQAFPEPDPLAAIALPRLAALPETVTSRWPAADASILAAGPRALASLPIDHTVPPVAIRGGPEAANAVLHVFVSQHLRRYPDERNQPEKSVTSGLSPYLHFGHISAHTVFRALMIADGWSLDRLATKGIGSRAGWWGASPAVEAYVDQLVTWRELGYNMAWQQPDYDQYDTLPDWAKTTLAEHADDPRPVRYDLAELESARTCDPLWNAAQMQLVAEGRIHNYLRMLWGKKILEWSASPQDALAVMIELNNKYALDGRNPNSYSGIFWVLGRYDRAWGPERPIYGKIRYMTSENTARKVHVADYIRRYARQTRLLL
ncbi:MAG: deoxyribodipyrimidine photolyase [Candidatus Sericytochromatia bacterium]|nr:deoxyribodipyrimidine photolyase [Candidatus Sericytochromatia bacterium]